MHRQPTFLIQHEHQWRFGLHRHACLSHRRDHESLLFHLRCFSPPLVDSDYLVLPNQAQRTHAVRCLFRQCLIHDKINFLLFVPAKLRWWRSRNVAGGAASVDHSWKALQGRSKSDVVTQYQGAFVAATQKQILRDMPKQSYRPLPSEDDGVDVSSQRSPSSSPWRLHWNIGHLIVNVTTFSVGIFVGLLLSNARHRDVSDKLAQYSMVPCKSGTTSW
jgi:hypothetical protein